MTYSKQLINELLEHTGWSKYRAAKELGVTAQYIGKIDKSLHGEQISNELARKIAGILGYNEMTVVVRLNEDKAETPEERKMWGKLLMTMAASLLMAPVAPIANFVQCIFFPRANFHTCAE